MHTESGDVETRHRHFGEDLLATAPDPLQASEGGTVAEALVGKSFVQPFDTDLSRVARRPGPQGLPYGGFCEGLDGRVDRREQACGVLGPVTLLAIGLPRAGVHADGPAPVGLRGAHHQLELDT